MPQAHGGALLSTFTPEARSKGGRVTAERRQARAERSEAVDDAMVGHVEKMSEIIAQLVEAAGEQYRCSRGLYGPKVPKLKLRSARPAGGRSPNRATRKQRIRDSQATNSASHCSAARLHSRTAHHQRACRTPRKT